MGERDDGTDARYRTAALTRPLQRRHLTRLLSVSRNNGRAVPQFIDETNYVTDVERQAGGRHFIPPRRATVRRPEFTWRNPGFEQTDDQPVLQISWNDAQAFCEWLSAKEGRRYRLPTEAEWEYACRAGSITSYSGSNVFRLGKEGPGNTADLPLREVYDFFDVAAYADDGYAFAAPVGQFLPNAWGLYDMHGNAVEWCSDYWDPEYYVHSPEVDPQGPSEGQHRTQRGASFFAYAMMLDWHGAPLIWPMTPIRPMASGSSWRSVRMQKLRGRRLQLQPEIRSPKPNGGRSSWPAPANSWVTRRTS
jgi:hypothetical protein